MTMTYRDQKGEPLTWQEVDTNFRDLVLADSALSTRITTAQNTADGKQPLSAKLTTLAAAVWAANNVQYQTGDGTVANAPTTAYGRSLWNVANAAGMLTAIGLTAPVITGTQDTGSWDTYSAPGWVPVLLNVAMTNGPTVFTPATTYWAAFNTTIGGTGTLQIAYARTEGMAAGQGRIAWRNKTTAGVWGNWRFTITDADVTTFGRSLMLAADATAGRTALQLGTAAIYTAQVSVTDATANRLMMVGAFGWGGTTIPLVSVSFLDPRPSGIYFIDGGLEGPSGVTGLGRLEVNRCDATGNVMEVTFYPYNDPLTTWRNTRRGGIWNGWKPRMNSGAGQSHKNTGKVLNTWYENTTTQTIYAYIRANNASAANVNLRLTVGGQIDTMRSPPSTAAGQPVILQNVPIPPGASYVVEVENGTVTLAVWTEQN